MDPRGTPVRHKPVLDLGQHKITTKITILDCFAKLNLIFLYYTDHRCCYLQFKKIIHI